ncbi:hypothetical protein [Aliarcobacter butzleri]|uniref:hypothetical protein n=1 Tax=Aliarcobacter butzleri TaxID=28197 RepID=UPI002B2475B9|nr:hypothetical protein [Aliarcobacter butzleri]
MAGEGIEPPTALSSKPSIRVEAQYTKTTQALYFRVYNNINKNISHHFSQQYKKIFGINWHYKSHDLN